MTAAAFSPRLTGATSTLAFRADARIAASATE